MNNDSFTSLRNDIDRTLKEENEPAQETSIFSSMRKNELNMDLSFYYGIKCI